MLVFVLYVGVCFFSVQAFHDSWKGVGDRGREGREKEEEVVGGDAALLLSLSLCA